MEIYSSSGFLIIIDPQYFQLASEDKIKHIDFMENPGEAAIQLEKAIFPDVGSDKIGLIILPDGPGIYRFDDKYISYWDVDNNDMTHRSIFGVEFGSYIIFDVEHIKDIAMHFNINDLKTVGEKDYINKLNSKIADGKNAIIWQQSQVGIGDGWHEIHWKAFSKC